MCACVSGCLCVHVLVGVYGACVSGVFVCTCVSGCACVSGCLCVHVLVGVCVCIC